MAVQTKTFYAWVVAPASVPTLRLQPLEVRLAYWRYFTWFQLIVAYVLMERALWSSRLAFRNKWALLAAITVFVFILVDRPSLQRMGLGLPSSFGASLVLAVSFATAVFLVFMVRWVGGQVPANPTWPTLHLTWEYVAWALIQGFMLQSFFSRVAKNCLGVRRRFGWRRRCLLPLTCPVPS